ncbi:MAG: glycosyltransferase family 4 protein [bacterium]|nr:glycosyltransferase family 4 protein [bacterium]
MKLYYVVNARMPNEKAHAIQVVEMCEAFIEEGHEVVLVVPNRRTDILPLKEYYKLRVNIPTVRLPVIDIYYHFGRFGYALSSLSFMVSYVVYLWWKRICGEHFFTYSVDMDTFSFAALPLVGRPCAVEIHGAKPATALNRFFFKRANVIATNMLIADALIQRFSIREKHLIIEPNGVNGSVLNAKTSKEEARNILNLPLDGPFALYIGRLYAWKGLEILADIAPDAPLPIRIVGGTREEYERVTGRSGEHIIFEGGRPVHEIPLWLAAADVLLLLGTAKNEDSYRYTAPMKVFEYLAARRPMIASATPALESIVPREAAWWYEPDNASSLIYALQKVLAEKDQTEKKILVGYHLAQEHTWRARAGRILQFVKACSHEI